MTPEELQQIIADHEADRVEFTVSTTDTDKFSEAVCAFANDLPNHRRPGYLLLGVSNTGEIVGVAASDQLLTSLGALRDSGNIQPLPSILVERVATSRGDVVAVTVQPSRLPPVRYKGRVCIRIGPRRAYATEQEERALTERRASFVRTFDAQPCLGSTLDDLAIGVFLNDYRHHAVAPEVVAENHRPVEQQLASLRFFDGPNGCPTHAGLLLFGTDVRAWLPGAYIQFLRLDGVTLSDPVLNDKVLDGDLLTVLRELDALVDAQLAQVPVASSTLREEIVENYPRVAVRELVMNGVMHRDYGSTAPLRISWFDDRVEVQSPGALFGEASPENFPAQTSYRNPVVAEALKVLGFVNRYGRGVLRAQDALRKNGSPPATFTFDAGYVLATIRRRP